MKIFNTLKTMIFSAFMAVCLLPVTDVNAALVLKPDLELFAAVCTSGDKQFRPSGSCGTEENTCCPNGQWSGWSGICCGSTQCWNGSICQDKPSTACLCLNGTCTKSWTCSASGWIGGGELCRCRTGYVKEDGICVKKQCNCTGTVSQLVFLEDGSCCCQDPRCGSTGPGGQHYICCRTNTGIY